ncbi:hypothetical protein [Paenibacillus pini]|uniref:Uncharacterized protein n=1 Tax=Paenibacillus pini JCM 16418 TaxID=1236976 RepID=W7YWC1_9BACL|nr:hypothetical protein [Paenibacillus pini]GAF08961.1 hypothetical protein JCM16418_3072 [Paenibacillus pini JCM 16418]
METILFNRDNEFKVILTSRVLTQLPILSNPEFNTQDEDAVDFLATTFVPKTL